MKIKIILVIPEAPLPFSGAASRWYYTLIRELHSDKFEIELFASCANEEQKKQAHELFPFGHFYLYSQTKSLIKTIQTLRKPFSYTIPQEMKKDFQMALNRGVDVVHIEQVFASWVLEDVPRNAFVSVHYLTSIDLKGVRFDNLKDRILMILKKKTEKRLLSRFGYIKSCSGRIESTIKDWFPEKKYVHFPFGIDSSQYRFLPDNERPVSNTITLIASMNWFPGKSAALRLLNEIWPKLKQNNPEMKLRIVGWQARSELSAFLNFPDVEILENVPDIKKYFYESALLIYTPSQGSGVKIKIQEAMLFGTPVITNDEGVEGLSAVHNQHALIANLNEEIISLTTRLFKDVDLQNELRKNARALIENTCDGKVIVSKVKEFYEKIIHDTKI